MRHGVGVVAMKTKPNGKGVEGVTRRRRGSGGASHSAMWSTNWAASSPPPPLLPHLPLPLAAGRPPLRCPTSAPHLGRTFGASTPPHLLHLPYPLHHLFHLPLLRQLLRPLHLGGRE